MNDSSMEIQVISFRYGLRFALSAGLVCFALASSPRTEARAEGSAPRAESSEPAVPADGAESDELRRELDEILAQPAFRRIRHQQMQSEKSEETTDLSWLGKPFKWLWDLLTGGAEAVSGLGGIWLALAWTALAAVCCLIIWLIVRAINSYRRHQAVLVTKTLRGEDGEQDLPPGDVPADEYRRRATEFVAEGKYREAIGQLILGAMSRTERQGLIRFRRGLTHRDYLRALRSREPAHNSFRTLVGVYEPICFGRRPASNDHFHVAERAYSAAFEELRTLEVAQAQ